MDPNEMIFITVWALIGLLMLRYVLIAIFGAERMGKTPPWHNRRAKDDGTVRSLEKQVATLTERVKVLEKITVEEGTSLAAEIERLREPEKLGYGGADELTDLRRSRNRV